MGQRLTGQRAVADTAVRAGAAQEPRPLGGGLRQWQVAEAWRILADASGEVDPAVVEMFRPALACRPRKAKR